MARVPRRILPGFRLTLGFTLSYLGVMVLIPLVACLVRVSSLTWPQFWGAVWTPRVRAAFLFSFEVSLSAAVISVLLGTLIAWVLVRYDFPFRRFFDSMVDLPFALPTAVAGLVYSSLYVESGWLGRFLVPLGINGAYSPLAVVLVLVFVGMPFVVRTVQPVLETFDGEMEEAAHLLGANRWQTFWRVLFPNMIPAAVAGFTLAFARALGEYGSVVFVSSNMPFKTEIAPVLIVSRLEEYAYPEASAIAAVLLGCSFAMLVLINALDRWVRQNGT